jgi:hypothetical protein
MNHSTKTAAILAAVVAVALAIGGALWFALAPTAPREEVAAAKPSASTQPVAAPKPAAEDVTPVETRASEAGGAVASTVVWPLKVELELIRGAHMPVAKDVQPIRTGANARLSGRILRGEYGIPAVLVFTAGPNAGRQLGCNDSGEFGATDLLPGLSEVRVEGPGVLSVREVRLAQGREEVLNVSFDLPGRVTGTVYDRESKGIEAVDVELDGQHKTTDENGNIHFDAVTGGERLIFVLRKQGYALFGDRVAVAAGRELELQPSPATMQARKFTMLPAATLELTLGARVGGKGDTQVVILPEQVDLARTFPWHRVSPVAMPPGTTRTFTDLPASRVRVLVFHDGAIAEPEQSTVVLREHEVARLNVRFSAAPAVNGVVRDREGRMLENALVTFEVADRNATTSQYFGPTLDHAVDREIIPPLAPAVGTTRTNYRGEFLMSSWPKFGKSRYLTAESADGTMWGGMIVAAGTKQVDLVVAPVSAGSAELSLDFPGRHQGLPIELSVNGDPRQPLMLPPNTPLEVAALATGTWRIRASWNGRSILSASYEEFDLTGDATRSIPLPAGAIVGQDNDTQLRANPTKVYAPGDTSAPVKR